MNGKFTHQAGLFLLFFPVISHSGKHSFSPQKNSSSAPNARLNNNPPFLNYNPLAILKKKENDLNTTQQLLHSILKIMSHTQNKKQKNIDDMTENLEKTATTIQNSSFYHKLKEDCRAGLVHLFWKAMRKENAFYLPRYEENQNHPIYKNYKELNHPVLQQILTNKNEPFSALSQEKNLTKNPEIIKLSATALREVSSLFPEWKKSLKESQFPLMIGNPSLLYEADLLPQILRCSIDLDPSQPLDFDHIAQTVKQNNIQLSLNFTHHFPESLCQAWLKGIKNLFETENVSELRIAHESFALGSSQWDQFIAQMPHLNKLRSFTYDLNVTCDTFCSMVQFISRQSCMLSKLAFGEMRVRNNHSIWEHDRLTSLPQFSNDLTEVVLGAGFASAGGTLVDIMNLFPQSLSHILTQDDQNIHINRMILPTFMKKIIQRFDHLIECQLITHFIKNSELHQILSQHPTLRKIGIVLRSQDEINIFAKEVRNMKPLEQLELQISEPRLWDLKVTHVLIEALSQLPSFQNLKLFPKDLMILDKPYIQQFIETVVLPILSITSFKIDLAFIPYLSCFDEANDLLKKHPLLSNRFSICNLSLNEICNAKKK